MCACSSFPPYHFSTKPNQFTHPAGAGISFLRAVRIFNHNVMQKPKNNHHLQSSNIHITGWLVQIKYTGFGINISQAFFTVQGVSRTPCSRSKLHVTLPFVLEVFLCAQFKNIKPTIFNVSAVCTVTSKTITNSQAVQIKKKKL